MTNLLAAVLGIAVIVYIFSPMLLGVVGVLAAPIIWLIRGLRL